MATEIELKLSLPPAAVPAVLALPLLAGSARQHTLRNIYYDTAGLELHHERIALRLRQKGEQWLQTVKTAPEADAQGLSRRGEWEYPATPGQFDFRAVDDPALRARLEAWQPRLQAVFSTDFQRHTWQLAWAGSQIELALDQGWIRAGDREAPICELELELLSGDEAALLQLSTHLQATLPLTPARSSKAERGYALFLADPAAPAIAL